MYCIVDNWKLAWKSDTRQRNGVGIAWPNDRQWRTKSYFRIKKVLSSSVPSDSVTRFFEISPHWQNILQLWQHFDGLFSIWQNFESTLAKVLWYWAKFHGCKWPNINWLSSHLVTLVLCRAFPHRNVFKE